MATTFFSPDIRIRRDGGDAARVERRRGRRIGPTAGALRPMALVRPVERLVGGASLPDRYKGAIVALGNFDGVHAGHQLVIGHAVAMARAGGVAAVVATFDPHPRRLFRPDEPPFRLTSLDQRARLLGALGVDGLLVFPFDRPLASVTPEGFVATCLRDLGGVVTGADFAFGAARSGTAARLAELCAERGLACVAVDKLGQGDSAISSSRIRRALARGDCGEATRLLTRPHAIEGVLRPGRRNDPALPLLDAGIALGDYLRPRGGVYAVRATLADGRRLGGSAFLAREGDELLELFLVDLSPADLGSRAIIELIAHLHDAPPVPEPTVLRRLIQADRDDAYQVVAGMSA